MDVDALKRNLNYTKKKHQNDKLYTGDTNISLMCEDVLNTISDMECRITDLEEENKQLRMKLNEVE